MIRRLFRVVRYDKRRLWVWTTPTHFVQVHAFHTPEGGKMTGQGASPTRNMNGEL